MARREGKRRIEMKEEKEKKLKIEEREKAYSLTS